MDDRERFEHKQLIARSQQLREDALETVASAKKYLARSKAFLDRRRDDTKRPLADVSSE